MLSNWANIKHKSILHRFVLMNNYNALKYMNTMQFSVCWLLMIIDRIVNQFIMYNTQNSTNNLFCSLLILNGMYSSKLNQCRQSQCFKFEFMNHWLKSRWQQKLVELWILQRGKMVTYFCLEKVVGEIIPRCNN